MFKNTTETKPLVPKNLMNTDNIYELHQVGETLGGFQGFLKPSKASNLNGKTGMMAYFFGENGPDSDTISALNLTIFLSVPVKITVWGLKNKDGLTMRNKETGKFPKLTQFIGKIQRPSSSNDGLTAKFFGYDGGNADAINELNKSEYRDALVYVKVQLVKDTLSLLDDITTDEEELENIQQNLTPKELAQLKKQQEKYENADNVLVMGNFYSDPSVLEKLGGAEAFVSWLSKQPCVIDNAVESQTLYKIPQGNFAEDYWYIPLSQANLEKLNLGELHVPNVVDLPFYFKQLNKMLLIQFGRDSIKKALKIPEEYFVDPNRLNAWVHENGLFHKLPKSYFSFLDNKVAGF